MKAQTVDRQCFENQQVQKGKRQTRAQSRSIKLPKQKYISYLYFSRLQSSFAFVVGLRQTGGEHVMEKKLSLAKDIACLKKQEEELRFKSFDEKDAWKLGGILRDMALVNSLPMVIDICIGTKPLFYVAMPGTTPENPDWVRRKVNTVYRFEKSSYRVGREYADRGAKFDQSRGIDVMNHADAGGSFPIHIIGTGVVGAVTVSGVPQREDHNFVTEGIAKFLNVDFAKIKLGPEK
jgi:uncharacterized protein (UPF0303 family)